MGKGWEWGDQVGGNLWRTTGDITDTWQTLANIHPTRLTPNKQITHITLWSLLAAPLLIGADMSALDTFTTVLLSIDEVLAVDQEPSGRQATRIARDGWAEVWGRQLGDGSYVVGLFNRGPYASAVTVKWSDIRETRESDRRHRTGCEICGCRRMSVPSAARIPRWCRATGPCC